MKIKFTALVFGTALSAFAFSACQPAANTNMANTNRVNSNTAVVVNSNTVVTNANTTSSSNSWTWNANVSKEEYEKNKGDYANRAKQEGANIGQGAEDAWLWTKTRAALATTNDLRESTINVDVDNSVVTLKGSVANADQKKKAEEVAKGISGVKSVKNELQVKPNDSMTNQMVNGASNSNANRAANTKK